MKAKNSTLLYDLKVALEYEGFNASFSPSSPVSPRDLIYIKIDLESNENKELGMVIHHLSELDKDLGGVGLFQLYTELFNNLVTKQEVWGELLYAANTLNTKLTVGTFCLNLKRRSIFFKFVVPLAINREELNFSEIIQSVWLSSYICNNFYLVFNDIITKNSSTKVAITANNLDHIYSDMI